MMAMMLADERERYVLVERYEFQADLHCGGWRKRSSAVPV
jgi:hypothetical protein